MTRALANVLPAGRPIDDDAWEARHRSVLLLLWAHAAGLAVFGLVRQADLAHLAVEIGAIVAIAAASTQAKGRAGRASLSTLGLISCSALLVHLSGGLIEAHFHFFIMVGVVTLYQSWIPFAMAMIYVVVHHGTIGVLDPNSVYNHQAAVNSPWLWAGIHGLFVAGAALAALRSWKYAEVERDRAKDVAVRLHEKTIRQREAVQLNDTVVQGLVAAKYAAELGNAEQAADTVARTLVLAQRLVGELMAGDSDLFRPGGLRRHAAAQTGSATVEAST